MPSASDPTLAVDPHRLLDTATRLVAAPSPTGAAGPALDVLADLLRTDGFHVERVAAGHEAAPAVVARLDSGRPGPCLQFNGHLDVVHLPFAPPTVDGDLLRGSGACDMKGGTAAAVEALRALRDSRALLAGSVLLTAHDLHEAPWGFSQQLDQLIRDGIKGDAVLIPEPLTNHLPILGRGQACWKATIRRQGPPVHEVMRSLDEPSVIAAAAQLVDRLVALDARLAAQGDSPAGRASAFIGQIHSGQIYNQYPQEAWLEGTRRWLPGAAFADVEAELRALVAELARETRTTIDFQLQLVRDAFRLDETDPFVALFQAHYAATSPTGQPLPTGPKPFVDDGNSFTTLGGVPAITHGPLAGGQHTTDEWVSLPDMTRIARLYARTAAAFCNGKPTA